MTCISVCLDKLANVITRLALSASEPTSWSCQWDGWTACRDDVYRSRYMKLCVISIIPICQWRPAPEWFNMLSLLWVNNASRFTWHWTDIRSNLSDLQKLFLSPLSSGVSRRNNQKSLPVFIRTACVVVIISMILSAFISDFDFIVCFDCKALCLFPSCGIITVPCICVDASCRDPPWLSLQDYWTC